MTDTEKLNATLEKIANLLQQSITTNQNLKSSVDALKIQLSIDLQAISRQVGGLNNSIASIKR